MAVVGGFHTPMERECLDLLLRGRQPLVLCPARSIERMRLTPSQQAAVTGGRLLVLSPFADWPRATAALADERNRFAAALAAEAFIPFAAEGGKTEQLARDLIAAGKPVATFAAPENARLLDLGARPAAATELAARLGAEKV